MDDRAKTKVIADDRERGAGVIEALAARSDAEIAVERLPLGDYLADDRLLFERKTIADFAVSIIDGRVFSQAGRLAVSDCHPVMILEGIGSDSMRTGVPRHAFQGAMIHVSVVMGIPILRSANPAETAAIIIYCARQIHQLHHGQTKRHGYKPKGKRRRQLLMLQSLPGVGPTRAAALLDRFESLANLAKADVEALANVDGVGPVTARDIIHTLSEQPAPYDA